MWTAGSAKSTSAETISSCAEPVSLAELLQAVPDFVGDSGERVLIQHSRNPFGVSQTEQQKPASSDRDRFRRGRRSRTAAPFPWLVSTAPAFRVLAYRPGVPRESDRSRLQVSSPLHRLSISAASSSYPKMCSTIASELAGRRATDEPLTARNISKGPPSSLAQLRAAANSCGARDTRPTWSSRLGLTTRQQGPRLIPEAKYELAGGFRPRQRRRLARPCLHAMNIARRCGRIAHRCR